MQRLSGLDAGFLYMETPSLHMHTLKLVVLDPAPGDPLTFEQMREGIGLRLALLPPLRRRLVEVPFRFHHPVWVDEPSPDLEYHVRRVVLPEPGTMRQLDDAVAESASQPLDRDRPLWRMDVFEGLAGGRIAVLVTVHHALADGVAASALLANAMATDPDVDRLPGEPVVAADGAAFAAEVPSRMRLLVDAFIDHVRQLLGLRPLARRTWHNVRDLLRHRRSSEVRPPVPILATPRTSFNGALTPRRSFATTTLSLYDARTVRAAFGVTLNDVVLAVVGGALITYLTDRGERPERSLVAGVPVSADTSSSPRLEGNRVSNLFTTLATDRDDPVERLHAIHEVTAEAKALQQILGVETFADWVQYTPPGPYAWFMRNYSRRGWADWHAPPINLVVSNVPGPREELFVAGATLRGIYSVGPILEGIGLNVTVWSYCDHLHVGVLGCLDAVPDAHLITEAMTVAMAELVARAGEVTVVRSPGGPHA